MVSDTEIVNDALTLLGSGSITSLADSELKAAVEARKIYAIARDAVLASQNWSFAITRTQMSAMAAAPLFQFSEQYQLPADCLRIVMVGNIYVGVDLSDFRGMPTEQFAVEGRRILSSLGAPLPLRYVRREEDTGLYHPCFIQMFAGELAEQLAEPLTQSDTKRQRAADFKTTWLRKAIEANAIELPATKLPDDEWIAVRM